MSAQLRRRWLAALGVAWLALVIALYFISHKPLSPAQALALARATGQAFVALGLLSLAGGLGARLLPLAGLPPLCRLSLQAALGLGLLAIGVLVAGASIGLSVWIAWPASLLVAALLRRSIVSWCRGWSGLAPLWREGGRFGRAVALYLASVLAQALITALAPASKFDALVYHLALPARYLAAGRVGYDPQIMFWGMPQTGEMLYTWAMRLAGPEAAALLGWCFGVLALAGLLGSLHARFNAAAAWAGAAALAGGATLASALSWGYVDWLALLFGWACLEALTACLEGEAPVSSAWFPAALPGVFAGFALGTKYTAGVVLLGAAVAVFLIGWKWGGPRRAFLALSQTLAAAFLVTLPWWLKNLVATGNPFYPFFFPSAAMDRLRLDLYQAGAPWGDWRDAIFLPLRSTLLGVDGGPGYAASIGPLLLGLSPLAAFGWGGRSARQKGFLAAAAILAGVGGLVWALAGRMSGLLVQSRLYFALFPALAGLAGAGQYALRTVRLGQVRLNRLVSALVLLVLGLNALQLGTLVVHSLTLEVVFGTISREDYLAANLGWYTPAMQQVRLLPEESQVLLLWEPRSLYCGPLSGPLSGLQRGPRCDPDEVLDRWKHDLGIYASPGKILDAWRRAGFTHLLRFQVGEDFVRREDSRYSAQDWQALDQFLALLPPARDLGGGYLLYSLQP